VLTKECLFCEIIEGKIPCTKIFENDKVFAFNDINPVAKKHILIIPKKHIENAGERKYIQILGELWFSTNIIAKKLDIFNSGYRVITNKGKDSGQIVDHIHLHLIGGETLKGIN
tara:strand:- start:360 stop:701 length:342 start_codon:yes stop_codon:yes gene_type:complete